MMKDDEIANVAEKSVERVNVSYGALSLAGLMVIDLCLGQTFESWSWFWSWITES